MAVGRDPLFLPPEAVGVGGQGMKGALILLRNAPLHEEGAGLLKVEG